MQTTSNIDSARRVSPDDRSRDTVGFNHIPVLPARGRRHSSMHPWAVLGDSSFSVFRLRRLLGMLVCMARKKTTVYIDESLLRAAKVSAARSGRREYEVFEDALRRHLGLSEVVERIWSGIGPEGAPSDEEAARIADQELAAARSEGATRQAG